jgi:hypothetical protein
MASLPAKPWIVPPRAPPSPSESIPLDVVKSTECELSTEDPFEFGGKRRWSAARFD